MFLDLKKRLRRKTTRSTTSAEVLRSKGAQRK